jgi:hypothetical protein
VVIRLDAVAAGSQSQRGVRTILLAAAALPLLTGCQSAVEKQRLAAEAQSGDLADCAQILVVSDGCEGKSGLTEVYVDNMHKDHAVRATVRKHSQSGDDDTDFAKTFRFKDVVEAYQYLESNQQIGKVVLTVGGVEKQTELDVSSDERSNHQSRLGAVVCRASQEP